MPRQRAARRRRQARRRVQANMLALPGKQRITEVVVRAPNRRRRRRRGGMTGLAADPFLQCVYGPMSSPGSGVGAPDGSIYPSVVIEHRQVVTITPSTNLAINLAIIGSPYGAIALDEGTATFTYNYVDVSAGFSNAYGAPVTTQVAAFTANPATAGQCVDHYSVIPFSEQLRAAGNLIQSSANYGIQAEQFRILAVKAKVSYTGDSFHNSGVASVCNLTFDLDHEEAATAPGSLTNSYYLQSLGTRIPAYLPVGQNQVASIAGAKVGAITDPLFIYLAPQKLDFQNMHSAWAPFFSAESSTDLKDTFFGGFLTEFNSTGPSTLVLGNDPNPGMGYTPLAFYAAAGMQSGQSITVEVVSCIEYTLGYASPMARFAKLPAPARPLAIESAKQIARTMPPAFPATPVTEQGGWLSALGNWASSAIGNVAQTGLGALRGVGERGLLAAMGRLAIRAAPLALGL